MQVDFFTDKIKKDINKLDSKTQEHIDELVSLLEDYGQDLRMPYSKPLGKGIFELRVLGVIHIRLLYCFHNGKAIVLNVVIKKQSKVHSRDILVAKRRKDSLA